MKKLLSPADAIALMLQSAEGFLPATERCALQDLDGRILAEPVTATITFPRFDNSAMDGYAIRHADCALLTSSGLSVIGSAFAGHPLDRVLQAGEAARIMTGAPLPQGADTVLMQENCVIRNGCLFSDYIPAAGDHVRQRGEDMQEGEALLSPGTRLTPRHIGLLAGLGIASINVYRKVSVALFSSGDELRQPGEVLSASQIYDSNRFALMAMLKRLPVGIVMSEWLPDDPIIVQKKLADAAAIADVVITSAGVSVGDADYMRDIITSLGEVNFWKVAMKPGKPFAFGRLGRSWYLGLPGNPVSSMVTMDQLAQPLLRRLSGEDWTAPFRLPGTVTTAIKKSPGRWDYQRGQLNADSNGLQVRASAHQGSGLLRNLCASDCYLVLEQERGDLDMGDSVSILPFGLMLS